MEYRDLNRQGIQASLFGMGCMRLPLLTQADGKTDYSILDTAEAIRLIRHGIDHGVTYLDTAWGYHGGTSETTLGQALRDGYRSRVNVATKMPVWQVKSPDDLSCFLDTQLARLETDHLDYYLLHALSRDTWKQVRDFGVLDFLDQMKKSGKIRQAGFSFHDQLPLFQEIIDSYAWDMCQIQLNLLDTKFQAGLAGLEYADRRGVGVVIMEPLRGGMLAAPPPADIQAVWDRSDIRRSQIEWAFRWLADMPEVKVILSGVSTMEQLRDNLRIFGSPEASRLTDAEQGLISEVQALYRQKMKVDCTGCNYCVPCPSGVAIPEVFRIYNRYALNGNLAACQRTYSGHVKRNSDASRCTECGTCEAACPQKIQIISKLAEADGVLRV